MQRIGPVGRLSIELEAALVRELRAAYDHVNYTYFRGTLRPAALELSDAEGRLGQWIPEVRTIEIGRSLVLEKPWGVVVEVLKHEMAHQYVHEVLCCKDETAHGPAFREVCRRLGIDAAAAGMPSADAAPADGDGRILERIARLLALAESPNVNEAQAAMSAAQRLMLKYNIDAARARGQGGRTYAFRHLGEPTGRVSEHARLLAAILAEHFFVEVIWVPTYRPHDDKRGSVLEVCGTPANLELAAYVHSFLTHTAERLWREHKRARGTRSDRDRRTFLAGVMLGFLEKLRSEQRETQKEGLVWVGDADLTDYFRKRHPRIQHVRYTGNPRTSAHAEGRAAGRTIVLHRPVGSGPSGTIRLLPGRRN